MLYYGCRVRVDNETSSKKGGIRMIAIVIVLVVVIVFVVFIVIVDVILQFFGK